MSIVTDSRIIRADQRDELHAEMKDLERDAAAARKKAKDLELKASMAKQRLEFIDESRLRNLQALAECFVRRYKKHWWHDAGGKVFCLRFQVDRISPTGCFTITVFRVYIDSTQSFFTRINIYPDQTDLKNYIRMRIRTAFRCQCIAYRNVKVRHIVHLREGIR
jgi:hypothetical protein